MMTNCPNCGAPIDRSRDSCEYCGTPYEKSNDVHIEVTAPNPSIEDFAEVLSRISRRSGLNLTGSISKSIQTTQQELLSGIASATAWKPTPEEERKMIEDMRNIASPVIFPKTEPTVELVSDRSIDKLFDTVWFPILLLIVTLLLSVLPFIF